MTTIEDLKKRKSATIGLIWMNMLIQYDYSTGESKVLQSFSRPAKESTIKKFTPKKEKKKEPVFKAKEKTESTSLF